MDLRDLRFEGVLYLSFKEKRKVFKEKKRGLTHISVQDIFITNETQYLYFLVKIHDSKTTADNKRLVTTCDQPSVPVSPFRTTENSTFYVRTLGWRGDSRWTYPVHMGSVY